MAKRKPVNLTIDEDVMTEVEAVMENTAYRTRSQLVEALLREWLEKQSRKA